MLAVLPAAARADAAADVAVETAATAAALAASDAAILAAASTSLHTTPPTTAAALAAAPAAAISTQGLGSAVRVSSDGRVVAFRLRRPNRAMLPLGAVLGDEAFPIVSSSTPTNTSSSTTAPLPFATPAASLGIPNGWALRTSSYYEATLLTDPPKEFGGVLIGLVDASTSTAIEQLATAIERRPHNHPQAAAAATAAAGPAWNAAMEANAAAGANAAMIAAGALLGTSKGGAFLSHRLATDPHTGTERNLLELVWFGVGGAQRRELTRGGASSSSSSKASSYPSH